MSKLLTLCCCWLLSQWAFAQATSTHSSHLTLLVSDAQAQFVAAAIDDWQQQHPTQVIQARSVAQLQNMEQAELQTLISQSKVVLGAGIYGPAVQRLQPYLVHPNQLFFNSDHALVAQSRFNGQPVFADMKAASTFSQQRPSDDFNEWLTALLKQHGQQQSWLLARAFWQAGGSENLVKLLTWANDFSATDLTSMQQSKLWPQPQARVRWIQQKQISDTFNAKTLTAKPTVVILDNHSGDRISDRQVSQAMCDDLAQQGLGCLIALSYWGEPAAKALEALLPYKKNVAAFVFLQDFVVGGGQAREVASSAFSQFNVPILKAIKTFDRTHLQRSLSVDGIAADRVYYQVAMPELQGASQPLVVANKGEQYLHEASGIAITGLDVDAAAVAQVVERIARWHQLKTKANRDKKVAIVYYNHPPGRHNIGADNLDVPASLWRILNDLKAAGYQVGELPKSAAELLDQLQAKGVNLPNQPSALREMLPHINTMSAAQYQAYFSTLPNSVQQELSFGPLGYVHHQIEQAVANGWWDLAREQLEHGMEEIHHLLEGLDHPARDRVIKLLDELEAQYQHVFNRMAVMSEQQWMPAKKIIAAIVKTGIEGLQGWGAAPGRVMVWQDQLLLPGLTFGNVFIGPQPPRGWEINEELLHANLAFAPPHQYLAFYHFLRDQFKADAIVHLGRHSTYEFLPRRSVGLMDDDYSRIIAANVPGIYPYIVDGVGEGIQAKRRGLAVMVDHLTPPLQSTPLYDELLQLRQLVESFEANHESNQTALKTKLVSSIRQKVEALELKDELAEFMSAELAVMGIGFEEVDDDMLVHEIGHYLTEMQERFMPLGLHVFGQDWKNDAVEMMLSSMAPETEEQKTQWQNQLQVSPTAERDALLNALSGGLVEPGKGNDPIRTPDSLPTGRNFYSLDSSLIPSPTAWALGKDMAEAARKTNAQNPEKSEAIVLWASDVVRDEGVMIAFGLNMMGIEPKWNSRGLVKGLAVTPLAENQVRRNTVFTSSGLFRDLYARQMLLINEAVLMALAQSGNVIQQQYPALTLALHAALNNLENVQLGDEPLAKNQVAAHWVDQARKLLASNHSAEKAGKLASLRVFGTGPGSYGAGVNRMVERSGAWQQREQVAQVFLKRMGHSYGLDEFGSSARKVFEQNLASIENTYLGRSSNLYGLMDNNDAFDYFGGLSLAIETTTGTVPNSYVLHHADVDRVVAQPLHAAIKQELRGRFLNPAWLKGLMEHDYAGARTMGSEFLEYLWGWQVTNPDIIDSWVWQEIHAVYMKDKYQIGLSDFLQDKHNAHVKANMLAIMLVAIHKGFWQADKETTESIAQAFVDLVLENGLPGSGHTAPNHPMLGWLESQISEDAWEKLQKIIQQENQLLEQYAEQTLEQTLRTLTEIEAVDATENEAESADMKTQGQSLPSSEDNGESSEDASMADNYMWLLALVLLGLLSASIIRQLRNFQKLA